jgi:oligo-1,6-glucosidase
MPKKVNRRSAAVFSISITMLGNSTINRDLKTINRIKKIQSKDVDLQSYLDNQKIISRDNPRTSFQWNANSNAGFTTGKPWLKINPNYQTVNVATEEEDANSPLIYFRKLC